MFDRNTLTFNPGWDKHANPLDSFTDIRSIQRDLKAQGVAFVMEADETAAGPASFMLIDPDGNPILVDRHVEDWRSHSATRGKGAETMDQKICMITGANSGIGKAAAIQIAQQGYHTILACRNQERGEAALREVREASGSSAVELRLVDMSLQSSIDKLAEAYWAQHDRLDVLIHNAAIFDITQKEPVYTAEGIESVWATNHLCPVLLTERLWGALQASPQGRVITIASKGLVAKPFLKVDLEDPEFKMRPFSVENAYYQSKLAQIMFTFWLAGRGGEARITANCIRVPAVRVDIDKYDGLSPLMKKAYAFKSRFALAPEEMAVCYTRLATAPELHHVTGVYFDEKVKPVKPPRYAQQVENIQKVMTMTMDYLKARGSWKQMPELPS